MSHKGPGPGPGPQRGAFFVYEMCICIHFGMYWYVPGYLVCIKVVLDQEPASRGFINLKLGLQKHLLVHKIVTLPNE